MGRQSKASPKLVPRADSEPVVSVDKPPYAWALMTTLAVGLLYAVTLSPTTAFWDTSEYIATGHGLGIPHPPGNPLFLILARTWDLLLTPFGLAVATRINLFSALMGSLAHGLWFMAVYHILGFFSEERRFRIIGGLAAVAVSATAFTVWNQSNVNEKVYTVSLLTVALLTWLAFHWRENLGRGRDDNVLVLMAFILALSVGNHLMAFLAAPALGVFVLLLSPRSLLNWRLYVISTVAVFLGLSIHMFLPLRAALSPIINEADPTCSSVTSALTSIITWGQAGCSELSAALSRQQYDKPPLLPRLAPLWSQYANYLQYFDWQWARGMGGDQTVFAFARLPFTVLFASLGVYGATQNLRRDSVTGLYFLVLFLTLSLGLVFYLNFKYGFSLASPNPGIDAHEVRERDYFFVVGFSVWGLWAGIGIAALWQRLRDRMDGSWSRSAPVLLLVFLPVILNWSWASRRFDYSARDWAYNLLMSVEPYGVLFTNGDNDTFPLWYLQEVEGIRQDVTVIVGQYLMTMWYPKQLQALTRPDRQRVFDPELAPGLFTDPGLPTQPIVDLSAEQMDQVAAARLQEDLPISFPGIVVRYPADMILDRAHQLALSIIHDSIDERPIYFASAGGMMGELGLERWGVRHGLVVKLEMRSFDAVLPANWVQGSDDHGGVWYDIDRSLELYENVYEFRGIRERAIWSDRSTLNIPWQYFAMALQLADVARVAGRDPELVRRLEDDSLSFQIVAQGGVRGTPIQ